MTARTRILPLAAVALVALLAGLLIGGRVGIGIGSDIWLRMSHVLVVSTGAQAERVLVLLDRGDEATLRWEMEREIDRSLSYLETLKEEGSLEPSVPLQLYERLRKYRDEHPRAAELNPPPAGAEAPDGAAERADEAGSMEDR
jgi:hypothetical protein